MATNKALEKRVEALERCLRSIQSFRNDFGLKKRVEALERNSIDYREQDFDVFANLEHVEAERDAMRECVAVLQRAYSVLDHCLQDDGTEPDWRVLGEITQALAKLDALKGGEK